jgi:CYTH domain-containing protein
VGIEIERKFVPAQPPPQLTDARVLPIAQGYLAVDDDAEVRIRRIGDRHVLTVKRGAGLRRFEEEISVSVEQFDALWGATEGRRLEKRRHVFAEGGVTFEVDVYDGELAGLIVAEVEFGSEEDSAAFTPPAWLGREVTGDRRYSNQQLALVGRPGG